MIGFPWYFQSIIPYLKSVIGKILTKFEVKELFCFDFQYIEIFFATTFPNLQNTLSAQSTQPENSQCYDTYYKNRS